MLWSPAIKCSSISSCVIWNFVHTKSLSVFHGIWNVQWRNWPYYCGGACCTLLLEIASYLFPNHHRIKLIQPNCTVIIILLIDSKCYSAGKLKIFPLSASLISLWWAIKRFWLRPTFFELSSGWCSLGIGIVLEGRISILNNLDKVLGTSFSDWWIHYNLCEGQISMLTKE